MLGGYSHLTDAELDREIEEYRKAYRELTLNKVASIAGEGRRIEFAGSSGKNDLASELRNLIVERATRRGEPIGGSISVEIG